MSYKVTYFPITALGEPIRFLLSYGGVDFEDVRCPREEWPQLKPKTPFGQMPVLEYGGKQAHQSMAICRYLGKQFGLAGKDDWENLEIDAIADTVNDLRIKIAMYHYETDEAVKAKRKEQLFSDAVLPFYLDKLEEIAKKNDGHLALGRLTWADLHFVALLDYMNFMLKSDLIAEKPGLTAVKNNVLAEKSIKAWMDKRPPSEM